MNMCAQKKKRKNKNATEIGTFEEKMSFKPNGNRSFWPTQRMCFAAVVLCADSASSGSFESVTTVAGVQLDGVGQLFSQTAFYKGQTVAVKSLQLHKKFDSTSKTFLIEIKKVYCEIS